MGNHKWIEGNYTMAEEKIAISDYDEILLAISAEVIYQQISQEEPFLQVQIDENLLSCLDISVRDKQLIIRQKTDSTINPSQFKIYTNSRNLSKIQLSGAGSVVLEKAVNAQNMEIRLSGSGNVQADSLYCENLQVKLSGSGNTGLKGAATRADFYVSGSGTIDAPKFLVQYLDCKVSGSGNIDAYATEEIKTTVTGSGRIRHTGDAKIVK
ncbi:DUF2807 domain-containing protein [Bacteroidia bacterium]|nr:DUF2807 domain-containing protein [Bacteroidia bacterium]